MVRVELPGSGRFRDVAVVPLFANSQQSPGISMIRARAFSFWLCVPNAERSEWLSSGDMDAGRMPFAFSATQN
jgi:hypothetical protein